MTRHTARCIESAKTQTVQDFPIGTLVRKGNGSMVYRVYRVSESQVAVCKESTVRDPSNGGWISPRRLVKVEGS